MRDAGTRCCTRIAHNRFKKEEARMVISMSREPYRTMWILAWITALPAGEICGLKVRDIDFDAGCIRSRQQADDRTRVLRTLKTRKSKDPVGMSTVLASALRSYLKHHWRANPGGFLFPSETNRPFKRATAVKWGLKPVLKVGSPPPKPTPKHPFSSSSRSQPARQFASREPDAFGA